MIRTILSISYVVTVATLCTATIIEKLMGTDFVLSRIYGSWWFSLLWVLLAVTGILWIVKRKMSDTGTLLLHGAFLLILLGAFVTHLTARKGIVHLRTGTTADSYFAEDAQKGILQERLPFTIRLDNFHIKYYEGTEAPADFESLFTVDDGKRHFQSRVSMNRIFSYRAIRLYQSSYDEDGRGSILALNTDPWGIPITYAGYALLFCSLLWMLLNPKGAYRKVLHSKWLKKGALSVCLLAGITSTSSAANVWPKETAEEFCRLQVVYNNRICPLQTLAIDFTKKIYGDTHYHGLTAEQVLTGWLFWGDEWSKEPFIKIAGKSLKTSLHLPDYASLYTFFQATTDEYSLGPYLREYYNGQRGKTYRQAAATDEKIQLLMNLRHGTLLKIFPQTVRGTTTWYAPTSVLPEKMKKEERLFTQQVFTLLYEKSLKADYADIHRILSKMSKYQQKNGGTSYPSAAKRKAERIYNAIPFTTILFMVNLTMGVLSLFYSIYRLTRKTKLQKGPQTLVHIIRMTVLVLSFSALSLCCALRWIIGGTAPVGNGYETMLLMAWLMMLLMLVLQHQFKIMMTFGFLLSGFFLLVSHINEMDPNITPLMPVLNSPLLSLHVSVIMMSFALLSLTFVCGITALSIYALNRRHPLLRQEQTEALQALSQLFLYPALALLGTGIFTGAIWANISWGTYWGWDPKEVWALVTFMLYAIAVHTKSFPIFSRPWAYHLFMVLAFASILMTYFGVNYFLGGMHSYA